MKKSAKLDLDLKSTGRRKAVKKIVGGVTALAAYNMMPVKWGTPIVEQIFLPAHAATSGSFVIDNLAVRYIEGNGTTGSVIVNISGQMNPPVAGQSVILTITP